MNSITGVHPEVAQYLAAVRESLADLPEADRNDLLAEVEPSLVAAASAGEMELRLGPPTAFAAELRAAAGLEDAAVSPAGRSASAALASVAGHLRGAASGPVARELAPIWWVARAYVAVALVGLAGGGWSLSEPALPHIRSGMGGLLVLGAALVVSIALGLRMRGASARARRGAALANALLVVAVAPVLVHLAHARVRTTTVPVYVNLGPGSGLTYDGVQVSNIYPYTAGGRMLHDVFLYDGAGRPIEIGGPGLVDPNRRVVVTPGGTPFYNTYPIRYFEPGTRHVAHPNAGPPIARPR